MMSEHAYDNRTEVVSSDIEIDFRVIDDLIVEKYGEDPENLIMILQAIQREYNFLPRPVLNYVSTKMNIPLSQIYGIATFYGMFSLDPKGRNIISICLGTACHVRGAERIKERLEEELGIKAGKTTTDMRYTLETVRCIGCCSLGPVVNINQKTYGRTDPEKIAKTVELYE
jgi:NADH:ubiquinone oxidoreductase subunit E